MRDKFITRYFPPAKAEKLRTDITTFKQMPGESLYEAWERLKRMIRSCPQHGLSRGQIVQTFYRGIDASTRGILDSSAGGVFMYKMPNEAYALLEDMSVHTFEWAPSRDESVKRTVARADNDDDDSKAAIAALSNQFKAFGKQFKKLNATVHAMQVGCQTCGGPHLSRDCNSDDQPMETPEDVNFIGNQRQGPYQAGSSNFQNYQKKPFPFTQGPPGFFQQNQPPPAPMQNQTARGIFNPNKNQPGRGNFEEIMLKFASQQNETNELLKKQLQQVQQRNKQVQRNHQASIQNLERDVGRISQLLSERQPGGLQSDAKRARQCHYHPKW